MKPAIHPGGIKLIYSSNVGHIVTIAGPDQIYL